MSINEKHPSYGMVQFSRTSCGGSNLRNRLFGSPLPYHLSTVRLRITEGERINEGTGDRYNGWNNVVEVELSPQQYADLLTTMNIGSGVPCTIRYIGGERIEEPPENAKSEIDMVTSSFNNEVTGAVESFKTAVGKAKDILQKKTLTVAERKELILALDMVVQAAEKNVPFWLTMFVEASTKVVGIVKAEVESFVTTAVQKVGLESMGLHDAVKGLMSPKMDPAVAKELTVKDGCSNAHACGDDRCRGPQPGFCK